MALRVFLSCLLALLLNTQAQAQSSELKAQTDQIAAEVMSPYCPGRTLNNCPSTAALELKQEIASDLASGKSSDFIFEQLIARFGEEVRAAPKNQGFGRVAWLMPLVFMLLGAVAILFWIKRNRSKVPEVSEAVPLPADVQARIDAEMNK